MAGSERRPIDEEGTASIEAGRLGANGARPTATRGLRERAALALQATRPLYIPTSLVPGAAGIAAAIGAPGARWWLAPVVIVALALIHSGTNVINDVEDFARGVDDEDKLDNSRVFNTGMMSLEGGRRLAGALFGSGLALGVAMALLQGPILLAIGIAGLAAGYCYSASPRPLKYAGLGDVTIVLAMGPLITQAPTPRSPAMAFTLRPGGLASDPAS